MQRPLARLKARMGRKIVVVTEGEFSWLERLPVTQEVAGSSPVTPAKFLVFLPLLRIARFSSMWIVSACLSSVRPRVWVLSSTDF